MVHLRYVYPPRRRSEKVNELEDLRCNRAPNFCLRPFSVFNPISWLSVSSRMKKVTTWKRSKRMQLDKDLNIERCPRSKTGQRFSYLERSWWLRAFALRVRKLVCPSGPSRRGGHPLQSKGGQRLERKGPWPGSSSTSTKRGKDYDWLSLIYVFHFIFYVIYAPSISSYLFLLYFRNILYLFNTEYQ